MKCEKRSVVTAVAVIVFSANCACARASSPGKNPPAIVALQAKADRAQLRDRCFLYAELVSAMTDLAIRQVNSGDPGQVLETLKSVNQYSENIHLSVGGKSRKLREAELLVDHASFRIKELLRDAAYEDRPALEETLNRLYQVRTQLMMQVFEK